jgi:hypothetical protein
MRRRQFLGIAAMGLSHGLSLPRIAGALQTSSKVRPPESQEKECKSFASGHFGKWVTDQFGLPAYLYTCNQIVDPHAVTPVHKQWRSATDHSHQVGNDRLVAVVSNYGSVQVRQDEGSPKFLNDYSPDHGRLGAGVGFLTRLRYRLAWELNCLLRI